MGVIIGIVYPITPIRAYHGVFLDCPFQELVKGGCSLKLTTELIQLSVLVGFKWPFSEV